MLLDSSAWVEFFEGSRKGEKIREIIKEAQCFTSIVSIAELVKWCIKNNLDKDYYIKSIEENSLVLNLKKEIVIKAGMINARHKKIAKKFSMLDSIIYATAISYSLPLITTDNDFSMLDNVKIIR